MISATLPYLDTITYSDQRQQFLEWALYRKSDFAEASKLKQKIVLKIILLVY